MQRNIWDIRMTRSFALRSSGQHCPVVRIPLSFPCRITWNWTAVPESIFLLHWDATGNGAWIGRLWIRSWRRRFIKWLKYMRDYDYKDTEGVRPSVLHFVSYFPHCFTFPVRDAVPAPDRNCGIPCNRSHPCQTMLGGQRPLPPLCCRIPPPP